MCAHACHLKDIIMGCAHRSRQQNMSNANFDSLSQKMTIGVYGHERGGNMSVLRAGCVVSGERACRTCNYHDAMHAR